MLKDVKQNNVTTETVIISVTKSGTTKNGSLFANGTLEDNTGKIQFVTFEEDIVKKLQENPNPNAYKVSGFVSMTNYPNPNTLQINIKKIENPDENTNLSALMPAGSFDHEKYKNRLTELINEVTNEDFNILLQKIFDGPILNMFLRAPGSMKLHHNYIGGLLEHTIDVTELSMLIASKNKNIDTNLIITGALLHDIGKISEISTAIGFPYTTEGKLLGHIPLSILIIQKAAISLNIPSTKLVELEHIIISHHGDLEKGSPVPCLSKEAFIVHYADEINAIMNQFDKPKESKETFEYNNMLKRALYKKDN